MSGWNYRIVRHIDPLPDYMLLKTNKQFREDYYPEGFIEWYGMHEVYYKGKGKVRMMTEEPIKITSETFVKKEYEFVFAKMKKALKRPVLDFETKEEISNETIKSCIRRDKERGKNALLRKKSGIPNRIKENRRQM